MVTKTRARVVIVLPLRLPKIYVLMIILPMHVYATDTEFLYRIACVITNMKVLNIFATKIKNALCSNICQIAALL